MQQLDEQAYTDQFKGQKAWAILTRLDKLRFYLMPEDIARVNEAMTRARERYDEEARRKSTGLGYVLPVFAEFSRDPDMDCSHYLPRSTPQ